MIVIEFLVKFHKNTYFQENFKYFQKPLILEAIQWYSSKPVKYESVWPMGSWQVAPSKDDIFDPDFAHRKM